MTTILLKLVFVQISLNCQFKLASAGKDCMHFLASEKKAEPVAATKRKYAEEKMEVDHPLPVVKTAIIKSDKMFPSKPSAPLPKKMKVVSDNEYFGNVNSTLYD